MAEDRAPCAGRAQGPCRHGSRRGPGDRGRAAGRPLSGVLLVFLDGVGIGPPDPDVNPFLRASLPTLRGLLGGGVPTLDDPAPWSANGVWRAAAVPLDATLGVAGLPQSGTGQATILTGRDGVALHGGHFGPWVPVRLRPLVEHENLLVGARNAGHDVAFANAYPRGWPGPGRTGRRVAGPPLAARGAGVLTRDADALARGDAVSSEIVNDGWIRHLGHGHLPRPTAREAGAALAAIAGRHALTLYAHYATDTAGHRGGMDGAVVALERVDAFLGGLLASLPHDRTLLVVSDHGNIEDVRAGHTRNPALGMVAGSAATDRASRLKSLVDVAPAVLAWLAADVAGPTGPSPRPPGGAKLGA